MMLWKLRLKKLVLDKRGLFMSDDKKILTDIKSDVLKLSACKE